MNCFTNKFSVLLNFITYGQTSTSYRLELQFCCITQNEKQGSEKLTLLISQACCQLILPHQS